MILSTDVSEKNRVLWYSLGKKNNGFRVGARNDDSYYDTMKNVLTLTKSLAQSRLAIFVGLLALSIGIPSMIHSQYLTGPIVNAMLFLATVLLGPFEAVMIGILPSTVALTSGLLPLPLAPMVPFIMISNAIMVACFHYIGKKRFSLAVFAASLVKFAFLYSVVTLLMKTMLAEPLVQALSVMMGYPQFITAIAGGVIAYLILKGMKKV